MILFIRIIKKHSTSYCAAADTQATARHYTLEKFHWLPSGWPQESNYPVAQMCFSSSRITTGYLGVSFQQVSPFFLTFCIVYLFLYLNDQEENNQRKSYTMWQKRLTAMWSMTKHSLSFQYQKRQGQPNWVRPRVLKVASS